MALYKDKRDKVHSNHVVEGILASYNYCIALFHFLVPGFTRSEVEILSAIYCS